MFSNNTRRMAILGLLIIGSGTAGCAYSKDTPAKNEFRGSSNAEKSVEAGDTEEPSTEVTRQNGEGAQSEQEIAVDTTPPDQAGNKEELVWYVTEVAGMDEGSLNVQYEDFDCSSLQTVKPDTCTDDHFGVIDQITISDFQTAQVITGFTCGKAPTSDACGGPYTPDAFVIANSTQNKIIASPRGLDVKRANANGGLLDIQMVGPDTAHREGYERVACAEGYDFVGIRQGRPDEGTYYYGAICRLKMN